MKSTSGSGQSISNIDRFVRDAKYPADRNELSRIARQNDAPQEVQERLNRLPDRRFNSASEVQSEIQSGNPGTQDREGNIGQEDRGSEGTMAGSGMSGGMSRQSRKNR